MSGFPRWPLHKAQAAAATPGQVRPNTAAAPPVALGGESVRRFPVTPVQSGGLRKRRPIAPPGTPNNGVPGTAGSAAR
jgi:hypothetical protein